MSSFGAAFAKARKEKGAGKTFTWQGKSYSTDRADDTKTDKQQLKSVAPKARPAAITAMRGDRAADASMVRKAGAQSKAPAQFNNPAKDKEADRKLIAKAVTKRNGLKSRTSK